MRKDKKFGLLMTLLTITVAAWLLLGAGTTNAQDVASAKAPTVSTISSTVPSNGDINPYGVFAVPRTVGRLNRGSILVSNFNASNNLQGTGTTIVQISPNSLWRKQPILTGASGMFGFVVLLRVLRVTLHFGFCRTHSAPTGA